MPTVFLVQESPNKDVISASQFGDVKVLMPPDRQIVYSPIPVVRHMRGLLKNFSDDDFILAMGDPSAIGIACALAADINAGKFKMLKWDRVQKRYYAVLIDIFPERRSPAPAPASAAHG